MLRVSMPSVVRILSLSVFVVACSAANETPVESSRANSDAPNTAPQLLDTSFLGNEDESFEAQIEAFDSEGDVLVFEIIRNPDSGLLELDSSTGEFRYFPENEFSGQISMDIQASDGELSSRIATVTLDILPIDDPPMGVEARFEGHEDQALSGSLEAVDVDSETELSFSIASGPQFGSLVIEPDTGNFVYTPNENFFGEDAFLFSVENSLMGTGVVSLNILPVNDETLFANLDLSTNEDTLLESQLAPIDVDDDELVFAVVELPSNGSASVSDEGVLIYQPNLNYFGPDQMIVSVTDQIENPVHATVSFQVAAVDDVPVGQAQSFTFIEDVEGQGQLIATDIDSADIDYELLQQPANAQVVLSGLDGSFVFSPNADYSGPANFVWRPVASGQVGAAVTAQVMVTPTNDLPSLNALSLVTDEDMPVTGALMAFDVDQDNLLFAKESEPSNGQASVNSNNGQVTYTPHANFFGADSFLVSVTDQASIPIEALVTVTVSPVDDAPVGEAQAFTFIEDTVGQGQLSAADIDSTNIDYELLQQPANAQVDLSGLDGSFTFTPQANYTGPAHFIWRPISDGNPGMAVTAQVIVTATNDPPSIQNQSFVVNEDQVLNANLVAFDLENDDLSFIEVASPANGNLELLPNGAFSYSPTNNFFGSDSFRVKVSDGQDESAEAVITLTVLPVDDAPVALAQQVIVFKNTVFEGQLAGTDIDSSPSQFRYIEVAGVTRGQLVLDQNTGGIVYTPDNEFIGQDSFQFLIESEGLESASVTISITVTEDLGTPEFIYYFEISPGMKIHDTGMKLATDQDENFFLTRARIDDMTPASTVSAEFWNQDSVRSSAQILVPAGQGALSLNSNGLIDYQSDVGAVGLEEFWADFSFDFDLMGVRYENAGSFVDIDRARVAFVVRFCEPDDPCANKGFFIVNNDGVAIDGSWQLSGDVVSLGNYDVSGSFIFDGLHITSVCGVVQSGLFAYLLESFGLPPDFCD